MGFCEIPQQPRWVSAKSLNSHSGVSCNFSTANSGYPAISQQQLFVLYFSACCVLTFFQQRLRGTLQSLNSNFGVPCNLSTASSGYPEISQQQLWGKLRDQFSQQSDPGLLRTLPRASDFVCKPPQVGPANAPRSSPGVTRKTPTIQSRKAKRHTQPNKRTRDRRNTAPAPRPRPQTSTSRLPPTFSVATTGYPQDPQPPIPGNREPKFPQQSVAGLLKTPRRTSKLAPKFYTAEFPEFPRPTARCTPKTSKDRPPERCQQQSPSNRARDRREHRPGTQARKAVKGKRHEGHRIRGERSR